VAPAPATDCSSTSRIRSIRCVCRLSPLELSFWHSATFSNDASILLFTDEWGGGTQAKCRASDPIDWGADALFTLQGGKLSFGGLL
jgi:hypothetical protein